ncbi:DUF4184 family protein [Aeromicrobium sp. 9AM]|uniref:DUF4184 family protein n=1 Tax=Aeromicrobium sp. 9AM TaxID=2653126 RepID=UPI0012F441C4|nr:DUF4184 family protein [Aeromicrobium sp. 9AM]VXC49358.1 conserved membrane hypothetical protein [Aeromicrobium sp. 9AM]
MPLTLSHPAAVLPLRRLGLPMAALVIGSMVPDIPLYLGSRRGYTLAHSPVGVPTVDVVGALLVVAVWFALLRDPLVDLSPAAIRNRLAPRARLTRRQWLLAPVGALIGAITHAGWDSFTHYDRWGSDHVGWLRADHLGMAGLKWAQYASGVLGLLVVAWFAIAHLRSLPTLDVPRPDRVLSPAALAAVFVASGLTGLASAAATASTGLQSMAFHGVVSSIIVFAVGGVLVCVAWQVRRFRREESVREA